MPYLTAVEIGPSIVVGGGDLAGIVKTSRPLFRVLVINDNGLWINNFI